MAIHDLAVENFGAIMSHSNKSALLALSTTCKSVHGLVVPLIYEDLTWDFSTASKGPDIHLLIRTLLHCPKLCEHVRRISVQGPRRKALHVWAGGVRPSKQEAVTIASSVTIPGHDSSAVAALIYDSVPEALVAIVLCLSHSLHSFDVGPEFLVNIGREAEPPVSQIILPSLKSLRNLRNINWGADSRSRPLPTDSTDIVSVLQLPSIESVTLKIQDRGASSLWVGIIPTLRQLKHLVLSRSIVTEEFLAELLAATPHLEAFSLDLLWDASPDDEKRSSFVDCAKLRGALDGSLISTQRAIHGEDVALAAPGLLLLRSLIISIDFFSEVAMELSDGGTSEPDPVTGDEFCLAGWGQSGRLGSLHSLPRLESLEVGIAPLLGWFPDSANALASVLPPGLRSLTIRDDFGSFQSYGWTHSAIHSKLEFHIQSSALPHLTSFTLRYTESNPAAYGSGLQAIEHTLNAAGIKFTLENDCPWG
ncbi:hypothetical protein EG328_010004 [Venturia inaequalis]|uniref:Uncharacterized protein n=1 Tax=Venturia inaequalis TaxID=5025 RepID=A0A8H3YZJ5_VENIN|nr:hypothetical protein EG327_007648 [Venturia inaequalis]KAE9983367.1 hypothetical protein EG328_010004 [Venturia inaequalis]RDI83273.1 hypothetical protein Vi05172_g6451 [Venturia inaequalis]